MFAKTDNVLRTLTGYVGVVFLSKNASGGQTDNVDVYSGRTIVVTGGHGKGQRTRIMHYDPGLNESCRAVNVVA